MARRLDGKVAVITGGASGIGRATVELFLDEGARVVAGDIQDALAATIQPEIGRKLTYVHADVTREDDIARLVEEAVTRFGRLDVMFNNAGATGAPSGFLNLDADEFDRMVALLLRAVFLGTKHAGRQMKQQRSGSIISTASVAGLQAGFSGPTYAACKAAVIHSARAAAWELAPYGIRANAICPGGIQTPILTPGPPMPARMAAEWNEVVGELLKTAQPLRRAGQPKDIAEAAVFLASDASSFITGQAIVVDGGATAVYAGSMSGYLEAYKRFMSEHEPVA